MGFQHVTSLFVVHFLVLSLIFGEVIVSSQSTSSSALKLSIIHLNDFHARFEETSTSSTACKSNDCIGGFARVYTAVNDLINERPNSIFLNAGDNFQGTLWYNIFKWNVTQYFLNMIETDAITLGNHEFDDKIDGVIPFLQTIKAPVVVCNINDTLEPRIQGLYEKSTVIERDGRRIGIVGVMLSTTNELSSTENLSFLDESESVNEEAQRLLEEENVFTVIVLSHCGYEIEQEIARKAIPGISVVVGAHSHTLLYTGTPPNGVAYGKYPTVVTSDYNETVLVVQASAYTMYLGNLAVEYDENGKVISWEGTPIYLDQSIAQDPQIVQLLEPYRVIVEEAGSEVLGSTKVLLDASACRYGECNFGNLITDAMVAYYSKLSYEGSWTRAAIGIINAGGIRTSIYIGDFDYNDLATAQPFQNTIDYALIQGKHIKAFMETTAKPFKSQRVSASLNLLQVSGIRVILDLSEIEESRVTSLKIRCHECSVPKYEEVDLEKYYPIAVPSFLVTGGDGFTEISNNLVNISTGPVDIDVITEYIKQQQPLIVGLDERITVISESDIKVVYH